MGVSRRDGRLASRPLLWFFRTDAASASLTSLIGNERAPLCDSRRLNVQAVASRVLYRQSARHQVPQLPSCGQTGHGARCVNHVRYRSSIVYRLYIIQSPVRQTYSPHMRVPRPHLAPPIPLDSISLLSSPPTGPRGDWCPTALSHSLAASLGVAIQSACSTAPRRRTSCLIFPPAPPVRRFPHEGWSSWSALRCGARWTIKQPVSASSTML